LPGVLFCTQFGGDDDDNGDDNGDNDDDDECSHAPALW
jgi:hypothetical protein